MGHGNMLDPRLKDAYLKTAFVVEAPDNDITLWVGKTSRAMDHLLKSSGVGQCAFITAWNPGSIRLSLEENERRQRGLIQLVRSLGYSFLQGQGIGRDPQWQPESSVLVLGVSRQAAVELGRTHGQLAIVFKEVLKPVELLLCDE